jgi:hypothetical protein
MKTILLMLCIISTAPLLYAETIFLILSEGTELTINENDPNIYYLTLDGGTLILNGNFNKESMYPVGNESRFPNVNLPLDGYLLPGSGTIRFQHCALTPPDPGDPLRFYHLPIEFDVINLQFEDCWLFGQDTGVIFEGRPGSTERSGIYANDTWFSSASTGVLSNHLANIGEFTNCRFAFGDTGVSINNGELSFANCEFVSLNTGISISGTGRLNLSNCLFQSCRTMLELSDSVTVAIDSSSFYEVESFCLAASSDSSLMDVSVNHCWFDSSSIANDQLLDNLPAGIITNQSDVKLNAGSDLVDIVIHVDDSEPMEASPGEFVRPVILTASFSYDDQNNAPIMPRHINLFSLPQSLLADSLHYLLNDPLYRKSRIVSRADVTLQGGLPTSRTDIITLDTLYFPLDENYFFVGTSDDEF